jgi:hypothetical protein
MTPDWRFSRAFSVSSSKTSCAGEISSVCHSPSFKTTEIGRAVRLGKNSFPMRALIVVDLPAFIDATIGIRI